MPSVHRRRLRIIHTHCDAATTSSTRRSVISRLKTSASALGQQMEHMTKNTTVYRISKPVSRWCAVPLLGLLTACGGGETPPTQAIPGATTAPGSNTPATAAGTNAKPAAAGATAPSAAAGGAAPAANGGKAGSAAQGVTAGTAGTGTTPTTTTTAGVAGPSTAASGSAAASGTSTAGASGSTPSGTGDVPPSGGPSCLDNLDGDYQMAGPFKFEAKDMGSVKILVPMVPAGCKVPVLHLANGTGASCTNYLEIREHLASWGFLTTCYDNANTGAGTQGIEALDTAIKAFPDLADKKIGSTGHSQGGQASFIVLQFAEEKWGADYTYAGLAMEPASGFGTQPAGGSWQSIYAKIKSPMFAFSGTADMLVPQAWVSQGYTALDDGIEAYHWSAVGATHIPVPDAATIEVSVPWFRWKLLGDKKACEYFKMMPDTDRWNSVAEQNVAPCM